MSSGQDDLTRERRAVKRAHDRLVLQKGTINLKIANLREACPHPAVEKSHGGNVGNWDPASACYWIDFNCPDCGKSWRENQ